MESTRRSARWIRWACAASATFGAFAFAACGGDDSATTPGPSPDAATEASVDGNAGIDGAPGTDGSSGGPGNDGSPSDANDGAAPGAIVTVTDQVGTASQHIAADGTNVYWTDQGQDDAGANVGRVMKAPVTGGAAVVLASYAGNQSTGWVGADGTYVYYAVFGTTVSDRGIFRIPVAGGPAVQVYGPTNYLMGIAEDDLAVALGSANLAFKLKSSPIVGAIALAGGTATNLTPNPIPLGMGTESIGADGTYAYWQNGGSSAVPGTIRKAPLAGGTAPADIVSPDDGGIAEYVAGIGELVVNGGQLYWANSDVQSLFKAPTAGGTPTLLASGPKVQNIQHLAVDGTNVYWIPSPFNPGLVMKVSVNGGTPQTLVTGARLDNTLSPIAVDNTNVYWLNPPYLFKTTK